MTQRNIERNVISHMQASVADKELPTRDYHSFPLFALALCLISGVLCAALLYSNPILYVAIGCVSLAIAWWSLCNHKISALTIFTSISFAAAGGALYSIHVSTPGAETLRRLFDEGLLDETRQTREVSGALVRPPEITPDGVYLTLRVDRLGSHDSETHTKGIVWLFAAARNEQEQHHLESLGLRRGTRLRVIATLERSNRYRNPGVGMLTEFLERKGYDAVGSIKSPFLIKRTGDEWIFPPLVWLDSWRDNLLRQMRQLFSPTTAGVLAASLLGNRYLLASSSAERFREGGTFHVLVISGMHITFIGGLVLTLARYATKRRFVQFIGSLIILWSYTLMVGAETSVVRAALTFSFVALAPILYRHADPLNAVGAAAIVLLTWRPHDLFDPSFQLTFLSVLAIVAIGWPLITRMQAVGSWRPTRTTPFPPHAARWLISASQLLYWRERAWHKEMKQNIFRYRMRKNPRAASLERSGMQHLLRYMFAALVVSASVQVALLPLLVVYFHRVSVASLLLNIWVGALMAALSIVSLAALALSQISRRMGAPAIWLAEHLNWLMTHGVDPFARWGVASTRLPEYTSWPASSVYFIYYIPLVILVVALARWNALRLLTVRPQLLTRVCAALLIACAGMILFHPWSERTQAAKLEINFLDVGQGDAALVVFPNGATMLIDGGGQLQFGAREAKNSKGEVFTPDRRSIGEAVVSEYLWWRGLDLIDYIVATHADADHIAGLTDVVRNFNVRMALVGRTPADDKEYERFAQSLRRASVPVEVIGGGDRLRVGEVDIEVLWPPHTSNASAPYRNNDSLVLKFQHQRRSVLLTGDIEESTERQLLLKLDNSFVSDVVKVAHHGSRTSSTKRFIEAARPSIAIVSVGQASPYGHPAQEVIERWEQQGARVMTTGRAGTITVTSDGEDLKLESFMPR